MSATLISPLFCWQYKEVEMLNVNLVSIERAMGNKQSKAPKCPLAVDPTPTSSSSSSLLFSISCGIPGYCISFPFSLLFVGSPGCPVPTNCGCPFGPLAWLSLNSLAVRSIWSVVSAVGIRFIFLSPSSSPLSSRTTPTTLPTSCYRANFRCFILTQWCALKA